MTCVSSKDSDQPGHPSSLIRVFTVRMNKPWVLSYPLSTQWRLWSDWANAQADLSLRWAHRSFCWFWHRDNWWMGKEIYIFFSQFMALNLWATLQLRGFGISLREMQDPGKHYEWLTAVIISVAYDENTCLQGFRPADTQIGLLSFRS